MVICQNDPQHGDFGAHSLLYKGYMIQMLIVSRSSDYCHRLNIYLISVWLIASNHKN